jgi:putative transposase
MPGLAFFALALVSVQERRSFPIRVGQIVCSAAEKAASQAKAEAKQQPPSTTRHGPGRPKGRKTQAKAAGTPTPALVRIRSMLESLLHLITPSTPLTYLVPDGHVGHHHTWPMAQQYHRQRSSKLRSDAALYVPDKGSYAGGGPHRRYGNKRDDRSIPDRHLKATTVVGLIQTRLYQAQRLHQAFAQALTVVIIVKTTEYDQNLWDAVGGSIRRPSARSWWSRPMVEGGRWCSPPSTQPPLCVSARGRSAPNRRRRW